ncbi:MAG TPA: superoxide dismutase [Desulfomonilaceae bacterium]|nr:superoxide dismutase [Desulfomonilaceae bacterium]
MENDLSRREVIFGAGAVATLGAISSLVGSAAFAQSSKEGAPAFMHKLPPLSYPDDALEPVIDKETVNIHYTKHFAAYVQGLNSALEQLEKARAAGNFDTIKAVSRDLAFNGSGVVLHWIYFDTIGPKAGGEPDGVMADLIKRDFGSFAAFWKQFAAASKAVEGSGWGILAWEPFSKRLVIMQSEKHQNLTSWGAMPLMVCDVWEHAYYLKYQNRRPEYVDNFAKIIDWKKVGERFKTYCSQK